MLGWSKCFFDANIYPPDVAHYGGSVKKVLTKPCPVLISAKPGSLLDLASGCPERVQVFLYGDSLYPASSEIGFD